MNLKSNVSWYVTPHSLVEFFLRFVGIFCLLIVGYIVGSLLGLVFRIEALFLLAFMASCSTLKMEVIYKSIFSIQ